MGFINKLLKKKQVREDIRLLVEEKIYEYVGTEVESGDIRHGLWVKATSTASSSDPEDVTREYIQLRVEHLYAEGRVIQQFIDEVSDAQTRKPTKKSLVQHYRDARDKRAAIKAQQKKFRAKLYKLTFIGIFIGAFLWMFYLDYIGA